MDNKNQSSGFFNGFFLGLLAGVVITLLFSTKKGREIMRKLIDGSEESLKELEDFFDEKTEEGYDSIQPEEPLYSKEKTIKDPVKPSVPLQFHPFQDEGFKNGYTTHVQVVSESSPPAQVRRFFRGIPKKV